MGESLGKCACGHLAGQEEFERHGECEECARLRKIGNGSIVEGSRKEVRKTKIEENKKIFANRTFPIIKQNALFLCEVSTIMVHITPHLDGCVALPIPSKDQEKMEDVLVGGWRGVVELVVKDMEDEPGVTCENAMEMSYSCAFTVELQENETATKAKVRVKKAFIRSWNKIVTNVEKGKKL